MASSVAQLVNDEATRFAKLLHAYTECAPEVQKIVLEMSEIIADETSTEHERTLASDAIVEAMFPGFTADVREYANDRMRSPAAREAARELDQEEAEFASRLKALMEERNMTQEQLAKLTRVSQPAISNILTRCCRPQRKTVGRFAEALGVSPDELWPSTT
jgi:lambda repressor-like predicted transcriptional regulator